MISHVSNAEVLDQAGMNPISRTLLIRQLASFGRVAAMSNDSVLRSTVLEHGTCLPKQMHRKRRVGRPRVSWTNVMYAHAIQITGNLNILDNLLINSGLLQPEWKRLVANYCNQSGFGD